MTQETVEATIKLEMSSGGSVLIKELYVGGCPKDDGSGTFAMDQYVVLYNNSSETLDISDFALGMVNPYNPHASNKDYVNGELFYAAEGWIPAGTAVWYFDKQVQLEAGKELVIALNGAIDHTQTYSQSVNLANSAYYCLYDIEDFNNAKYYPSPSELISTDHYLKAYKYGWVMHGLSASSDRHSLCSVRKVLPYRLCRRCIHHQPLWRKCQSAA